MLDTGRWHSRRTLTLTVTLLSGPLVACSGDAADILRELDAARGECTEERLRAADEECIRMFERYAEMGSEAMETYIGGMRALDAALARRSGEIFDTTGLGRAVTPALLDRRTAAAVGEFAPIGGERVTRLPPAPRIGGLPAAGGEWTGRIDYWRDPPYELPGRGYYASPLSPWSRWDAAPLPRSRSVPGQWLLPDPYGAYRSPGRYGSTYELPWGLPSPYADPWSPSRDPRYATPPWDVYGDPYPSSWLMQPSDWEMQDRRTSEPRAREPLPPVERGVLLPPEQRLRRPWLDD